MSHPLFLSRRARGCIPMDGGRFRAMEVQMRHTEGAAFVVSARGHEIMCDQPRENGAGDGGLTPPELLLASLGTCAGYYALQYLRARKLPETGLAVRVEAENAASPARLGRFAIHVDAPPLEARHEEGLLRAVRACLIHNTMHASPEIATIIHMRPAPLPEVTMKA